MVKGLLQIIEEMEQRAASHRSERRGFDARKLEEWARDLRELYAMIERL